MEYTEQQKKLIANHLLSIGKKRIYGAGIRTVDLIARIFFEELEELGAKKQAQELYEFYQDAV